MFKKSRRIRLKKDIEKVYKKGSSFFGKNFIFKALPNNYDHNRYLVVIGKKAEKSAVRRNLVKRKIRATLNELDLELIPGNDIMIIVRNGNSCDKILEYHDINLGLCAGFKKMKLYK